MLQQLNTWMQRFMPVFPIICITVGIIFDEVGQSLVVCIPYIFACMTFASGSSMRFRDIKIFKQHTKAILLTILFLHILMPVWAYFLGTVLLNDPLLRLGFVIAVAVPTGVSSLMWVSMCKGNIPLSLAIILIDTLLAPIVLPAIVHIVASTSIEIDTKGIVIDLLWMIVAPSILAIFFNEWGHDKVKARLKRNMPLFSKLAILSIITINSSVIAPFVKDFSWHVIYVVLLVFVVAITGYALAFLCARFMFTDRAVKISFIYNAGMRNIAVGVVIATSYFPAKVAMPVVLGMLFQQMLAAFFSKVFTKK